jgi:hypothetical protein
MSDIAAQQSPANDPAQVRLLTLKGLGITMAIAIFAVVVAFASIYARRTPMEKTRDFFGDDALKAIQLGEQLRIEIPAGSPMINADAPLAVIRGDGSQIADLSGSPGLGHFRHALLNQRHYDWDSITDRGVEEIEIPDRELVFVEIEGRSPDAPPVPMPITITPTRLVMELTEGWVGVVGVRRAVRMTERVRTGMRNFIDIRKDIGSHPSR